jgi:hypothetical protein
MTNYLYSTTSSLIDYLSASSTINLQEEKILDQQATNQILSSSSTNKEDYVEYFDSRFPRVLSLILLFIGLFGNLLCFYIFSQPNMRKNSTFIYLACLSIVDWFVLVLGLGDIVIISYLKTVLRDTHITVCRIHSFLTYVFTHLSSFLLASVSIDRAIATNLINFSKIYSKPQMAYKIIFLNILVAAVINFHSLLFMGYYRIYSTSSSINDTNLLIGVEFNKSSIVKEFHCATESGTMYDKFLDPYFKWIDLFSYAIIPFLIMAVCTFLIIRVLFESNRRLNKKKHPNSIGESKLANNKTNSNTNKNDSSLTIEMDLKQQSPPSPTIESKASLLKKPVNTINKKPANHRANKAKHLTYTLITLNCLFFCLVSPLVITLIALDGSEVENKILINFVYLLAYSNHSFNFILYGLSSPPYRESLFKIFRIKK